MIYLKYTKKWMLPFTMQFEDLYKYAFLYVKANSKEIWEEISFPSFFQKNADASIFVEIQD